MKGLIQILIVPFLLATSLYAQTAGAPDTLKMGVPGVLTRQADSRSVIIRHSFSGRMMIGRPDPAMTLPAGVIGRVQFRVIVNRDGTLKQYFSLSASNPAVKELGLNLIKKCPFQKDK